MGMVESARISQGKPLFAVRFWGTRGSIATPGMSTVRYGGNTACTEVRCGEHILVLDAGTGIRELGRSLLQEFGTRPIRAHIFLGHTHWDHIQGLPFFEPAYVAGNQFTLYASGRQLRTILDRQMDKEFFPVGLSEMAARLEFVEITKPVAIGPAAVAFVALNHPGGATGFRLTAHGRSVVYMSDHEPGCAADNRIEAFVRQADLLICDAMYTAQEYSSKKGWGHGTFESSLQLAARAQVRMLAFFHHDPTHGDDWLDQTLAECRKGISGDYPVECRAAREGEVISLL
jgi:phosphoribosyl 1,2-cyclic phosphodiesterase